MDEFDIQEPLENGLAKVIEFLPNLLAAIVILLITLLVAKLLSRLVGKLLRQLRFDRAVHNSVAGAQVTRVVESPTGLVTRVTYWLIFLGGLTLAVSALGLPLLNDFIGAIYSYVPAIIGAILIFLVASVVSGAAVAFVQRVMGRTMLAKTIATVIPAIVMSIAVFMILNHLGIARDIVNILFTAIVGSIALGMALAFGLGGKDVARELLEQAAGTARERSDTAAAEMRAAAKRAGRDAKKAKESLQ